MLVQVQRCPAGHCAFEGKGYLAGAKYIVQRVNGEIEPVFCFEKKCHHKVSCNEVLKKSGICCWCQKKMFKKFKCPCGTEK
jgi:hypothetical protein